MSIASLGHDIEVTLLTLLLQRQAEESGWQKVRGVWSGSVDQAREVIRSRSIAIRRWALAVLAHIASIVTLAAIGISASAQTTQTYTEIVKPGFITGGGYNSVQEEFAVTQAWWAASCIANPGYSCVSLDNLHACSNNTAYNWGEPQDWCWHFTRTAPNGVIESQGIATTRATAPSTS